MTLSTSLRSNRCPLFLDTTGSSGTVPLTGGDRGARGGRGQGGRGGGRGGGRRGSAVASAHPAAARGPCPPRASAAAAAALASTAQAPITHWRTASRVRGRAPGPGLAAAAAAAAAGDPAAAARVHERGAGARGSAQRAMRRGYSRCGRLHTPHSVAGWLGACVGRWGARFDGLARAAWPRRPWRAPSPAPPACPALFPPLGGCLPRWRRPRPCLRACCEWGAGVRGGGMADGRVCGGAPQRPPSPCITPGMSPPAPAARSASATRTGPPRRPPLPPRWAGDAARRRGACKGRTGGGHARAGRGGGGGQAGRRASGAWPMPRPPLPPLTRRPPRRLARRARRSSSARSSM